ncbi:MAG: hypothetical protein BWY83_02763 [bacterium ADurb.Bin478]|nr:MAG: hypothetical protein BWY83_02763 [bacterium ADurb.Bin478]
MEIPGKSPHPSSPQNKVIVHRVDVAGRDADPFVVQSQIKAVGRLFVSIFHGRQIQIALVEQAFIRPGEISPSDQQRLAFIQHLFCATIGKKMHLQRFFRCFDGSFAFHRKANQGLGQGRTAGRSSLHHQFVRSRLEFFRCVGDQAWAALSQGGDLSPIQPQAYRLLLYLRIA